MRIAFVMCALGCGVAAVAACSSDETDDSTPAESGSGSGSGGADGSGNEDGELDPPFSQLQSEIFTPSCAFTSCHGGDRPPRDLSLTEGESYASLLKGETRLSIPRVTPGDPDQSALVKVLEGSFEGTSPMPLGQPPLEEEQIELVRRWIAAGAQP